MTPEIGHHVKCVFRNGAVVEGMVEEWATDIAQLRSLDEKSILIIAKPAEDIMLIKIMLTQDSELNITDEEQMELPFDTIAKADKYKSTRVSNEEIYRELGDPSTWEEEDAKYKKLISTPSNLQPADPLNHDYNKSLVELRKDLATQEREILANKLRAHRPTIGGVKVKYEQPGFNKKPSTK